MTLSPYLTDKLIRTKGVCAAISERSARHWLRTEYRKALYGGYRREDGTLTDKPHYPAIEFHRACQDPLHSVFFIGGGRRSSKTFSAMSEFCSWIRGERPWDGTKTAPIMSGRTWLMTAANFSTAFPEVICPEFEKRMDDLIIWKQVRRNQQKVPISYPLKTGDSVRCNSYEQFLKVGHDQTSVFELGAFAGALCDEHPPRQVWLGIKRGLVSGMSNWGWGKAIIAATPEDCGWILNDIYAQSYLQGGDERSFFAMEFTIWDNPGNTEQAIHEMSVGLTEEERQARLYGRFPQFTGRVYGDFDENMHVVSDWDPLLMADGETPSDWPVICAIDPHDRRPPFITWAAISPHGDFYFVDEYPNRDYEKIARDAGGFDDWKQVIEEKEAGFPGGAARVLWRVMDPKFGRSSKAGTRLTIQEEMQRRGLYFRTDFLHDNAVLLTTGHRAVKGLLAIPDRDQELSEINRPKLFVKNTCRNILWGFHNYIHKDGKEVPEETGKDSMDDVRFTVMARPQYTSWQHRGEAQAARARKLNSRMVRARQ